MEAERLNVLVAGPHDDMNCTSLQRQCAPLNLEHGPTSMTYPPKAHSRVSDKEVCNLVMAHPFAHLFTHTEHGSRVTRVPFAFDQHNGKLTTLRGHINAQNPQAEGLEGQEVLVAFSGPDTYVSPNWRTSRDRAATWDYQAVHVWGRVRLHPDRAFFDRLINDLAESAEIEHSALCPAQKWSLNDAPSTYVRRLFPHVRAFEVSVNKIEAISKLHQDYSRADRERISDHLVQSEKEASRGIGLKMKALRNQET